ncbi:MAG: AcrR family transcriptional regulator [Paracoccaceae bacterium]|jgi:AcrR family transcriptional regulator
MRPDMTAPSAHGVGGAHLQTAKGRMMHPNAEKLRDRAQKKTLKRQEKKDAIAFSAIKALSALGYANTTLRDIAADTDLSLGMLHYYFDDKAQLVIYCVSLYKQRFVAEIDATIDAADTPDALITAFANGLAGAVVEDWDHHRLWYDIRAQAMFSEDFRPIVAEIEAALIAVLARAAGRLDCVSDVTIGYAALDGVFRQCTYQYAMGAGRPRAEIAATFAALVRKLTA